MLQSIEKEASVKMEKSIDAYQSELSKIRTGRAHPSLLDQVTVTYYGAETPLNQLATVSVADSRTLAVTPFDKSATGDIEKAIMNADLGLNPTSAGQVIRVPLPPLTEERRKDLIKVVKQCAENARVAIRNIRRDANQQIKDALKDKMLNEDEARRGEDNIQKVTNDRIAKVEEILGVKEKDLMAV